jgi:hypothetical protein
LGSPASIPARGARGLGLNDALGLFENREIWVRTEKSMAEKSTQIYDL